MTAHGSLAFRSDAIAIEDFHCPGSNGDGNIEVVSATQLCIVRTGLFAYHAHGREHIADSNSVLLLRRGLEYKTRHPDGEADDCTVHALAESTLRELTDTPDDCSAMPHIDWTVRTVPAQTFREHWALVSDLSRGPRDPDRHLALEERALHIAADLFVTPRPPRAARRRVRPATERAHRDLVESVKELIALRLTEPLRLEQLAAEVGWSPFELSRLFRERTGFPIHRYRRQLRLRTAFGRLAGGAGNIGDLAHELGFASHSHFSDAFRGEFGLTPREARSA